MQKGGERWTKAAPCGGGARGIISEWCGCVAAAAQVTVDLRALLHETVNETKHVAGNTLPGAVLKRQGTETDRRNAWKE